MNQKKFSLGMQSARVIKHYDQTEFVKLIKKLTEQDKKELTAMFEAMEQTIEKDGN